MPVPSWINESLSSQREQRLEKDMRYPHAHSRVFVVTLMVLGLASLSLGPGTREVSAQDTAVTIVDFAFDPGSVTVTAGSTVTWTNNGAVAHTVTSDSGAFDSGSLDPGATFSQTFDTPGTFAYFCSIHPNMTGTITVTEAAAAAPAEPTAAAQPAAAQTAATPPAAGQGAGQQVTQVPSTGIGAANNAYASVVFIAALAAASLVLAARLAHRRG